MTLATVPAGAESSTPKGASRSESTFKWKLVVQNSIPDFEMPMNGLDRPDYEEDGTKDGRCHPSRSPQRPPSFIGPRTGSMFALPLAFPWIFQSLTPVPPMVELVDEPTREAPTPLGPLTVDVSS